MIKYVQGGDSMNYYVDFDNTLYETVKLTSLEMEEITKTLSNFQSTDDRISIIIIYKDLGGKTYNRIFTASKKT